jgi:hypothetical protein
MLRNAPETVVAKLPGGVAATAPTGAVSARPKGAERRVSPSMYKFLVAAHVITSVGWLGVVIAKIVLGVASVTTASPEVANALYMAMNMINYTFPPLAIATIVTGVILSLGTKWGLLQHYWTVTKIVLTVGVILTAVQLGSRVIERSGAAPFGSAADGGLILGLALGPALLLAMSAAHLLMLVAATVISIYKPWGKTWFGRRTVAQRAKTT